MCSVRVTRDATQLMHWHRPGRQRKKLKGHTSGVFYFCTHLQSFFPFNRLWIGQQIPGYQG